MSHKLMYEIFRLTFSLFLPLQFHFPPNLFPSFYEKEKLPSPPRAPRLFRFKNTSGKKSLKKQNDHEFWVSAPCLKLLKPINFKRSLHQPEQEQQRKKIFGNMLTESLVSHRRLPIIYRSGRRKKNSSIFFFHFPNF